MKIKLPEPRINGASIIWRHGLENDINGALVDVQKYIDDTVLRLSEPYTPFDTGTLSKSGTLFTDIGSGEVEWNTPYARAQYYGGKAPGKSLTGRLRGKQWFERMKADRGEEIIKGAQRRLEGK